MINECFLSEQTEIILHGEEEANFSLNIMPWSYPIRIIQPEYWI